jgi:hypothetical protein
MDSRFNIPAPAVVKLENDMYEEMVRRLKVAVCPQGQGRGGFGQTGSIKPCIEKTSQVFPRSPVP